MIESDKPYTELIRLNHEFQQMLMAQQANIVQQQKTIENLEDTVRNYEKLLFHETSVVSGKESDK